MAEQPEIEIKEEKEQFDNQQNQQDSDDDKVAVDGDKKANRGEKKFKKAMIKLGMKQVTGITRVTIKRGKQFLLYIDDPEVFKSAAVENSYIVFGEAKVHDPTGTGAGDVPQQIPKAPQPVQQPVANESNEDVSEDGVPPESIKMVMDHCKCDRSAAVKALKASDNFDTVQAILQLTS